MSATSVYCLVNRSLDNQVCVSNYNCDAGMVRIEMVHEMADIMPAQARILADALIVAADQIERVS